MKSESWALENKRQVIRHICRNEQRFLKRGYLVRFVGNHYNYFRGPFCGDARYVIAAEPNPSSDFVVLCFAHWSGRFKDELQVDRKRQYVVLKRDVEVVTEERGE